MDTKHEIFHKPYEVKLQFEKIDTPAHYRSYPEGVDLPARLAIWKVQTKEYPDIDPGLVSPPEKSPPPDYEAIAGGLNSKSPKAVAIGRHGNFFLWGFSAPPSLMTPSARQVFVNSICYIHKFDHMQATQRRHPAIASVAIERDSIFFRLSRIRTEDQSFLDREFPSRLVKQFGRDAAKYRDFYRKNIESLHPADHGLDVDEDVLALGGSNRNIDLLERCIQMLEQNEREDLALQNPKN